MEKNRGAGLNGKLAQIEGEVVLSEAEASGDNELARPKLFIFNIALTIAVIALLIKDIFPSYVPFMIGVAVAILVNYPGAKMQKKIINSHAGPALMMCSTLMGAAVLMGILVKSVDEVNSVITCMSNLISAILPAFLGQHLPLVIGILSVPLALAFDTDSYFYGMLPVMIGIGEGFGIAATPIAVAMVVCRNCATFISPMVPATLLGVGLADVDIKDHIKNSFLWVWGFSFVCMLVGVVLGIIPL
jgi:CitMHS family citrate-Mg2+:H+ or citrate-Ca2+:H+ symporter